MSSSIFLQVDLKKGASLAKVDGFWQVKRLNALYEKCHSVVLVREKGGWMKPRYRPGKVATSGKDARKASMEAKPAAFKRKYEQEKELDFVDEYPKPKMKGAESETFSHEGIRKLPKRR